MRSRHRISAQSEVVWRVKTRFEKTAKVWRLPTEFHVGMAVDVMLGLGSNFVWAGFQDRGTSPQIFARFAHVVWEMLQNRWRILGASCTFMGHLARFGIVGGDLSGTWASHPRIFLAKFCKVGAGVEWGAHTKFQANRRSFGGWTRVLKNVRRFGGYSQNLILEWQSLWCSDWAEILCENVSDVGYF